MNTLRTITVMALAMGLMAGAALAKSLDKEPGYVDLEWIEIPADADEIQDIDLSPMLLSMAKDAEDGDDEALMEALTMVRSIRVKSWTTGDVDNSTEDAVKRITAKLKKDDWKRLIYVKDDDETVAVSARYKDDDMVGLMLVVHEPGDSATFVNVVGDLDLATLFKLAGMIEADEFEMMLGDMGEVHHHDDD